MTQVTFTVNKKLLSLYKQHPTILYGVMYDSSLTHWHFPHDFGSPQPSFLMTMQPLPALINVSINKPKLMRHEREDSNLGREFGLGSH